MSQAEADDFTKYVNNFLKRPILPSQEAQIICALIDGTINRYGAKQLFNYIIEQNLAKHNEIIAMSKEQILELIAMIGSQHEPMGSEKR